MGLLKIHNDLVRSDPALIDTVLHWLKKEYKATIEVKVKCADCLAVRVEGEGIPKNDELFDITVRCIVPGVISISL